MKNWILFLGMVLALAGCEKEEALTPSYADRDWWIVEDSDDKVGHELFLLYEKYGIPVYVNDTIGYEERGIDAFGNPVVYYKVIDLDYSLGQTQTDVNVRSRTEKLLQNETDKLVGIHFLDEYFIPLLPEELHVNAFLLLDSLYETRLSGATYVRSDLKVFVGLTAMAIGQVPAIAQMTSEEQAGYAVSILSDLAIEELNKTPDALNEFYNVSRLSTYIDYYGKICAPANPNMPPAPWEAYGFLTCAEEYVDHPDGFLYRTITRDQDLIDFVGACYQYTEEEFTEKYGEYPLVMEKYGIMVALLSETIYF